MEIDKDSTRIGYTNGQAHHADEVMRQVLAGFINLFNEDFENCW
ncbi:hypothetical protein [Loigolactobacillus backii]|nr:hypothetical protein [Loigolactobacillus backii]